MKPIELAPTIRELIVPYMTGENKGATEVDIIRNINFATEIVNLLKQNKIPYTPEDVHNLKLFGYHVVRANQYLNSLRG